MLGTHLTLDFYSCNSKQISDAELILDVLNELPDLIGMRKISSPQITDYSGNPKSFDKGGISGFVLIAESHITIHTFVEQQFASIDIFSCKDFDVKKAESYLVERFEPKKIERHVINRGMEFPKDVMKAKEIVIKSRKKVPSFS